jgi:hypothetical protein
LPLAAWAVAAGLGLPGAYLLRFFAGFCLVANGAYIGGGSFDRLGDARQMLQHGSPIWLLWAFGVVAVAAGLGLWHRQGRHFSVSEVSQGAAYATAATLAALLVLGFAVGGD